MFADYIVGISQSEADLIAAEHIDILTMYKIDRFEALTPFQQRTLLRVHKKLTEFETENADILDSLLTSYSVNGVSMAFGGKVKEIGGVSIPAELYAQLCATGLCYPAI